MEDGCLAVAILSLEKPSMLSRQCKFLQQPFQKSDRNIKGTSQRNHITRSQIATSRQHFHYTTTVSASTVLAHDSKTPGEQ